MARVVCLRAFSCLIVIAACLLPTAEGYAQSCRIKLKNGNIINTPHCYEENGIVYISKFGGYVGLNKSDVEKIDKSDVEELAESPPELPAEVSAPAAKDRKTSSTASDERRKELDRKRVENLRKHNPEQAKELEESLKESYERQEKFREEREAMREKAKKNKEDREEKKREAKAEAAAREEEEKPLKEVRKLEEIIRLNRDGEAIACGRANEPFKPTGRESGEEAGANIKVRRDAAQGCEYYKRKIPQLEKQLEELRDKCGAKCRE